MSVTLSAPTAQRFAAIGFAHIEKMFANAAYDENRTLAAFLKKGVKKLGNYPSYFGVRINLKATGQAQAIPEYGEFNVANVETADQAQHTLKTVVEPIVMSDMEMLDSSVGTDESIDLFDFKGNNAKSSIGAKINKMLLASSAATDEINSLEDLIGTGTFGGLAVTSYPNWSSQVTTAATILALLQFETKMNDCTWDAGSPDLICVDSTLYAKLVSFAQNGLEIRPSSSVDFGFDTLTYKGATIYWDRDITANHALFMNTKGLQLAVHKARDMFLRPVINTANALTFHQDVVWRGELIALNRRSQGKFSSITTS